MWKDEIQPFMDFSLPLIFRLRHFFIERLNFFKIIALKTMFSLNKQATLWQKKKYVERCNTSFMKFSLTLIFLNDSCL
jgi:hypothetical protein